MRHAPRARRPPRRQPAVRKIYDDGRADRRHRREHPTPRRAGPAHRRYRRPRGRAGPRRSPGRSSANPDTVVFKTVVTKEKNQVVADGKVDLTASADSMTASGGSWSTSAPSTSRPARAAGARRRRHRQQGRPGRSGGVRDRGLVVAEAPQGADPEGPPGGGRRPATTAWSRSSRAMPTRTSATRPSWRGCTSRTRRTRPCSASRCTSRTTASPSRRRTPSSCAFVNGVLQQMRDDGRLAALYAKYLGSPPSAIPPPVYTEAA